MMSNFLSLSVVLPAYNEAQNIGRVIANIVEYFGDRPIDYEIIVVNDGSTDATKEIALELAAQNNQIRLINHTHNLGYGAALRSGFDQALHEYIFLTDGDGQFEISDLDRFLPHIYDAQGKILSKIIIGYRAKRADVFMRSLNAWMYHIFIQWVLGIKIKDIDCAFKLFPKSIYQAIKPVKSNGALFSAELLLKMQDSAIMELPVQHLPRRFGMATGANWQVILKMFWECWQLKREHQHQIQLNPNTLSGINQIRS
jgi:glycosyltransferase involved in cell wall biosynthesis